MALQSNEEDKEHSFPCTLTLHIPFPSSHLASTAHRALAVDAELSPLVHRSFSTTSPERSSSDSSQGEENSVLQIDYAATTPRMLRVAVNGFFESLGVVLGVMRELDVDVVYEGEAIKEGEGVQGLEVR